MIVVRMGKGSVLKSSAVIPIQRRGKRSNVADVMMGR
jgi:hypothetical protein